MTDKISRHQFRSPKSDHIHVGDISYHSSSASNRVNDLYEILSEHNNTRALGIISDGGLGCTIRSVHNLHMYDSVRQDLSSD